MNKKLFNKYTYIIIAALLIGTAGFFYFKNASVVKVKQVNLKNETVEKTVSASGTVSSDLVADLSFRAVAKLATINVKEGDTVKKDQLLAKADLTSAYLTSKSYESALEQAKTDRDKYVDNYADNLEAAGGRENYEFSLKKYNEALSAATSNLAAQQSLFTNYYINSPIDGTVVEVTKKLGETISTGETIIKIANLDELYFKAQIDQEDLGQINLNQKTVVTLDSFENKEFMGSVFNIQKFLKSGKDTVEVTIKFDTNGQNILYGMTGDAKIINAELKTDKALQFDYLNTDEDNKNFVWVVENKKLVKKFVSLELEGDLYSIPKEDLKNAVIVVPMDTKQVLKEGQEVSITK